MAQNALAVTNGAALGRVEWNAEQRKIIRDTFANGANDAEFSALMETARVRGLDPFKKQVFFVKRWDSQKRCEVWAVQISIDGLRGLAERTGRYDGQDEPEYVYDAEKRLTACKVRVYRKDHSRPSVGVAFFAEYAQTTKEGKLTKFWAQMPHVMIAKCAEALAIRKGFPEDTSGLFTEEEMAHDDSGRVGFDGEIVDMSAPAPESGEVADPHRQDRELDTIKFDLDACTDASEVETLLAKLVDAKLPKDHPRRRELMAAYAAAQARTKPAPPPVEVEREPGEEG